MRHSTLEDVAKVANVSTATVSRCLNNPDSVKSDTRERVLLAVKELGYAPNFGARALAARKTQIIGAIIPTMENAIFATGLQAFQESLSEAGYTLLVSSSSYSRRLEEEQIYNLVSRGADGLLLIGEDRDPEIYEFLHQREIPYVLAWNYRASDVHSFVGFDNYQAAGDAAKQVINAGHKNIAIISGLTQENDRARDRKNGYLATLREHNVNISTEQIVECPYSFDEAARALGTILKNAPQTTAIICGNDILAVGSLMEAKNMGIDVPSQLSIIGFDDIEISKLVSPSLSTVHVPHRQMGRHAASILSTALGNQTSPRSVKLEPYFVMRETLSHPPMGV